MALKGKNKNLQQRKKQQQNLVDKEAKKSTPWPDLPKQIVNILGRNQNLEKNINFGGVIKSWRTAPKQCKQESTLPSWLQLSDPDGANIEKYRRLVTRRGSINTSSLPYPWWCWWRNVFTTMPRYPWKEYVGCSNGILVAEGEPLCMYYLWNPTQREWYHLPFWNANVPIKLAVVSSSPEDRNFTAMVLTGISHPAFAFYKLKKHFNNEAPQEQPQWTTQDCTITEPHSLGSSSGRKDMIMQFTNAIGFKGKFYALSLQGTLAVIEEIDSVLNITALSDTRAVPSVSSNHCREYLLESDGEILLVYLISRKSSMHVEDHVEVYRLNLARLSWLKLESLGGRTLFVGSNCIMSVLASEVGCRRNCIYFRHLDDDEWWVYDMESGNISPGWGEGNPTTTSAIWIEPIGEE